MRAQSTPAMYVPTLRIRNRWDAGHAARCARHPIRTGLRLKMGPGALVWFSKSLPSGSSHSSSLAYVKTFTGLGVQDGQHIL